MKKQGTGNHILSIALTLLVILMNSCYSVYQRKLNQIDQKFEFSNSTDTNNIYIVEIRRPGCWACSRHYFISYNKIRSFSNKMNYLLNTDPGNNIWQSLENVNWRDTSEIPKSNMWNKYIWRTIYKINPSKNTKAEYCLCYQYTKERENGILSFFVFFRNFIDFIDKNKFKITGKNINSYPIAPQR